VNTLEAPKQLEDVITPGSLASFLGPSAFEPLRETTAKLQELAEEGERIQRKLLEVENAIQGSGVRRVKDASRLADLVLSGEIPKADPEPEKGGLAACSVEQLRAIGEGLRQKTQANKADADWYRSRAKTLAAEILKGAATAAATRYCELMNEAAGLHVQLAAAERLLSGDELRPRVVNRDWADEVWRAPLVGVPPRQALYSDDLHQSPCLAIFRDSRGVPGAMAEWREVVKAGAGLVL
jgi:hypothetical protein